MNKHVDPRERGGVEYPASVLDRIARRLAVIAIVGFSAVLVLAWVMQARIDELERVNNTLRATCGQVAR